MKAGDLVKYAPTSWAAFERRLINSIGVVIGRSGRYWGVSWTIGGMGTLEYHLEEDIEVISESR